MAVWRKGQEILYSEGERSERGEWNLRSNRREQKKMDKKTRKKVKEESVMGRWVKRITEKTEGV
jgi:hypothetical protein